MKNTQHELNLQAIELKSVVPAKSFDLSLSF